MKKLALAALLLIAGAALWAAVTPQRWLGFKSIQPISATDPTGYIVSENFEGGNGQQPEWTIDAGTLQYETNSPALVGSFSYFMDGTGTYTYAHTNHIAVSDVWFYLQFQVQQAPSSRADMGGEDPGNGVASISVDTQVYLASGSADAATVGTITLNTTYQMWVHWVSGVSAEMWISNNGTRDSLGPNYKVTHSVGVFTGTSSYFRLAAQNRSPALVAIYDKLRVSTSQIGDNPP